ncbi:MAG: hypothetical protein NTX63_01040, partial [Candidatus Peregrinibacteria bacterium]|nr:hypothetical protein [Candidatus Peregrinibacteria bacterium]
MFFKPFEAVDMIKKGNEKAFALMLLVASALSSLAILLVCSNASFAWMNTAMKGFSWTPWNYAQYFVVLLVGIYIANALRAALIHLVMRIFTEKGALLDAFKVSTVNCFLMSVYLLLAVILAAIPMVGLGLAVVVIMLGMLITISVSLKTLAVLYKTDIITSCIAIGIIMVTAVCAIHLGLLGAMPTKGLSINEYGYGTPRMMQQWGAKQGQYQYYPGMMAPYFNNQTAPTITTTPIAP